MALTPDIKIRGIRTPIPSGYVLGRTQAGHGDVHLIPIDKIGGVAGVGAGGGGGGGGGGAGGGSIGSAPVPPPFVKPLILEFLGFSEIGTFSAHQQFALAAAPVQVLFPSFSSGTTRSVAVCAFPPASNYSFVLTDDLASYLSVGTHVICTVSFAAGAVTGTFAWTTTPFTVVIGKVLYLVMNATPDPAFSNVQVLFCGDPQ